MQKQYWRDHGTSMRGMMTLHGVDPTHYLDYVHDIDYSPVPRPIPRSRQSLAALPGRKIIFTAGDVPHAEKVMERLGVAHHFEAIFDIVARRLLAQAAPGDLRQAGGASTTSIRRAPPSPTTSRSTSSRRSDMGMRTVWIRTDESVKRAADAQSRPHPSPDRRPRDLARRLGRRKERQEVKILILGAGAVGGYWGARLHQAGIDVTFLLREKRAETVQARRAGGEEPKGDAVLPVKVVTKGERRRALRRRDPGLQGLRPRLGDRRRSRRRSAPTRPSCRC